MVSIRQESNGEERDKLPFHLSVIQRGKTEEQKNFSCIIKVATVEAVYFDREISLLRMQQTQSLGICGLGFDLDLIV